MAVTSWITPSTLSNDVAGAPYSNPGNALVADGVFAVKSDLTSIALLVGKIPAGSIPAGASLTGAEIFIKGQVSAPSGFAYTPGGLLMDTSSFSTMTRNATIGNGAFTLTSTNTVCTVGDPNSMPGFTGTPFTVSEYNSGNVYIGFYVSGNSSSSTDSVSIDNVGIRFYYTGGEPPSIQYTNTGTGTQTYTPSYAGFVTSAVTFPTAAISSGGSGTQWVNPTNIFASDNVRSTMTFTGANGTSSITWPNLIATGYGFSIPTGSTIVGITVGVEAVQTGGTTGNIRFNIIQLLKAGSNVGTNKSTTTNIATTESTINYGSSSDLWGTTWAAEDINASNFGVVVHPLATTAGTNRVFNVDAITVQVTYVPPPASGNPTFSYSNSGVGSQSYTPRYDVSSSYTNTGVGSQSFSAVYGSPLTFSYTNTGVGSQSYVPIYGTALTFSYTNSGTGTQSYAPKYSVASTYANSGVGTQSYVPTFKTASAYSNAGSGSQTYAPSYKTSSSYTNTGVGAQSYSAKFSTNTSYLNSGVGSQTYAVAFAGAGTNYVNSGVGTQNYVPRFTTNSSYVNSGVGTQTYSISNTVSTGYVNSGVGTQTYTISLAGQPATPVVVSDGGWSNHGGKGRSIHAPADVPKPTRQEKKNARKAEKAKLHVVDQSTVDALKAGIEINVPMDPFLLQQIELARLEMEAELAARIEEEELQMVMVMALAHHRRNRFRRLAA